MTETDKVRQDVSSLEEEEAFLALEAELKAKKAVAESRALDERLASDMAGGG